MGLSWPNTKFLRWYLSLSRSILFYLLLSTFQMSVAWEGVKIRRSSYSTCISPCFWSWYLNWKIPSLQFQGWWANLKCMQNLDWVRLHEIAAEKCKVVKSHVFFNVSIQDGSIPIYFKNLWFDTTTCFCYIYWDPLCCFP
jgi:hypothetical protein